MPENRKPPTKVVVIQWSVVQHRHAQPFAAWSADIPARYLGAGTGLIDEDQRLRTEVELAVEPSLARSQDVRTVLLNRITGLFARRPVASEEAPQGDTATAIPSAARAARNSARMVSGADSYNVQMRAALTSVVAERVSPLRVFL